MRTLDVIKIESVDCGVELENGGENGEIDHENIMCRICLDSNTNTKLYNLHSSNCIEAYASVIGIEVSITDGLPQQVCNICATLLQKMAKFKEKCLKVHTMLIDALVKRSAIMTDIIQNLDEIRSLQLSRTKILNLDFVPSTDNKIKSPKIEVHEIKKEEKIPYFQTVDDDCLSIGNTDNAFTMDDLLDNIGTGIKEETIDETEETILETEESIYGIDEEAYSLRNTKKKRKGTDSKKKVKKKIKKDKSEDVVTNAESKSKVKEKLNKRLYNRKTEEDFVSFSKTFNVEVVFLTREQQLQEVQSRKESEDYITSRFQCDVCYKSFMKESAYKKHMDTHDPRSGSHECDICFVRFPIRQKLMKHLRQHKKHFICKYCSQISKDSTTAKMHYKWHEGFKYECKHCGKNFNKPSSYLNHVRENHSVVTCDTCREQVAGTRALANHKKEKHKQSHMCPKCSRQFNNTLALDRHLEIFDGRGLCEPCLRPCLECGVDFVTAEELNNHLEKDHNNLIFRCQLCNTTYATDRQLGIHWARAHRGQKRGGGDKTQDGDFMCEVCAKSYPSETILRYHQRLHTGEKPFQCPMCPKTFRMKTNMQVHINTHTGARPYKCKFCPETFKSYSQKHKHRLLVHTKERRHKCHMCEKTYVVSCDLKMHIRTAHMKMPLPPRARRNRRKEQ